MNRPTDSVRIVLFDRQHPARFLILAEADDPDNWKLPGGKFDTADEAPAAAASRELREELQVEAADVRLTFAGQLRNDDGVSARHIFAAAADPTDLEPSAEIAAVQWVGEDDIPASQNRHHMASAVALARTVLLL